MEGKRISDLTEVASVPTESYTIIVDGTDNKKIKLTTITKNLSDKSTNLENRINTNETEIQEINTQLNNINMRIEGLELSGNLVISDVEENELFEIDDSKPIVNVTGVTLNKSTTTISKGSTETLTATITPSNATNKNVTWATSNSSIATVSNGVVTGVANGSCNITVTTEDGNYSASCSITVETIEIPLETISLDITSHTLKVDETVQLTPAFTPSNATNKNVTWSTNNENCTVVNGMVTGITEGESIITCISEDGNKTATCTITVQAKTDAPEARANVIYEEDGYLCVPVDKITIKEVTSYSKDNYKMFLIGEIPIKNTSLLDADVSGETVFKQINLPLGTWNDLLNASDLTEKYAVRAGNYIGFKILTSSLTDKTVEQYFKEVVFGEYVKFKLKADVVRYTIDTSQFTNFTTRTATVLTNGQCCKVSYPNLPTIAPLYNFSSLGFSLDTSAAYNKGFECIAIIKSSNAIEFLFNPDTLTELTLERLTEYLNTNGLTIWTMGV